MNLELASYTSGLMHGAGLILLGGVLAGAIRGWWETREPRAYRVPRARMLRAQRLALKSTALMRRSAP